MALDIIMWAGAINLVLFIRVMWRVPAAIRLTTEAEFLSKQAEMLWAQIEQEKLERGITADDFQRERARARQAEERLAVLERLTPQEPPCATAARS